VHLVQEVELSEPVLALVHVLDRLECGTVLGVDLANRVQPVVDQATTLVIDRGAHATTLAVWALTTTRTFSQSHCAKSTIWQRTTWCTAWIGPLSTSAVRSAATHCSAAAAGSAPSDRSGAPRFTKKAAGNPASFQFHPDQTLTYGRNGSLAVQFKASGLLEMCWHFYAWGDLVRVIKPKVLRDLCASARRSGFPALP